MCIRTVVLRFSSYMSDCYVTVCCQAARLFSQKREKNFLDPSNPQHRRPDVDLKRCR